MHACPQNGSVGLDERYSARGSSSGLSFKRGLPRLHYPCGLEYGLAISHSSTTVRNRFREVPLPAYFGFATTASDLKLRSRICAGSANSSFLKICCYLPLVASANATSRRPVAMMVYLPEPGYVAYSPRNRAFHNCLAKPI